MIIDAAALANIYVGLTTAFNAAFQETEVWYPQVAMTVPANTKILDYKFMLEFPMVREWVGDRVVKSLEGKSYQITTKDWEATIEVDRNDIRDDQIGLYAPIVAALGEEARNHPDKLIADLMKTGWSDLCFDGQPFFSASHPVGSGIAANDGGGSGTPWLLLDVRRSIKPFIYQLRQPVQLSRMDRADDEHVFMRRKYRYGVDARYTCAYGLWQLAYGSKQDLDLANYAAARAAMMTLKNADGRPLGVRPNLLVVPPALEATAREILHSQFVIADAAAGGMKSNVWQNSANLLVAPELA
ncbi:MAG: Mu-like prophage major head subunit gpT family protein [Deltaproteobacteria bacterium]|nr:Mu-like prophage major head subunit gpT family protein [Deltaproteobacteria bacterium]